MRHHVLPLSCLLGQFWIRLVAIWAPWGFPSSATLGITLPSTLLSHGAHGVNETPLTISLGQEQPDLFTHEKLLSKELQSALIRTAPHGLRCLPCALGHQECTFLLAADVLCWVGGWDAFQLSPYH